MVYGHDYLVDVALTLVILIYYDLSSIPGPVGSLLSAGSRTLEAVHSGHVGDYVAWITFGVAILGGVVAMMVGR